MIVTIAIHAAFIWVLGLTMQAKPVDNQQVKQEVISPLTK